jgi:type I restriction enzyme M protein
VALPDQLFYNTGISTYFWVVTNRKAPERRGKVQLVDAREYFVKMRKSLGAKRNQISDTQIEEITRLYGDFIESEKVKVFPNEAFGFMRITVERPLRLRWEVTDETIALALAARAIQKLPADTQTALRELLEDERGARFPTQRELVETFKSAVGVLELGAPAQKALWSALAVRDQEATVITDRKGNPEPDPELRDSENVPLPAVPVSFVEDPAELFGILEYRTAVDDYMRDEVLPYVPDAWVDHDKTRIGYEIPLTRYFYTYVPPRPLDEIDSEINTLEQEIQRLLGEVTE